FGLPHGLAIAIAMPHVIKFNAVTGHVKRTPYPHYETYRAQEDYAEISRFMGFAGKDDSDEKAVQALVAELKKLTDSIDINIT
ncbi:iron-containing alcohol dehydrogenase, partial [Klebsiella pneumoniae]|nr:iron-containing alcohol dehydrogenase [Klebsiella pneumoniae]